MALMTSNGVRSGTKEWLFQRVANALICVWTILFIIQVISLDEASFANWQALFEPMLWKLFTSLTLLVVCLNSVLAGWQIGTDYIKVPQVNSIFMLIVKLGSFLYAIAGLYILWVL
ncbi:succinate dehydrogenase, hydrophobic membrane anchor protein [Marinomonas epiphytica]